MGAIHGHAGLLFGGGTVDAFPQRIEVVETKFETATTAHNVAMPGTVNTGDLLLNFFASDAGATITTPSGWTLLDSTPRSTIARGSWYYRVADGTEGGTVVDFVTSAVVRAMAQVHRFQNGTFAGTPECTAGAVGGSTTPDPPNLAPSFGSQNTFWIASAVSDNSNTPSAYPLGNGQLTTRSASGGGAFVSAHTCFVNQTIASLDPGTYTLAVFRDWIAHTVAIRGV